MIALPGLHEDESTLDITAHVADGARLSWRPQPLIVARGARLGGDSAASAAWRPGIARPHSRRGAALPRLARRRGHRGRRRHRHDRHRRPRLGRGPACGPFDRPHPRRRHRSRHRDALAGPGRRRQRSGSRRTDAEPTAGAGSPSG